ncbi:HxlR family transcriptional regulator [Marivita geojedonensis]|uniref:HxlR family transcriptional regulator n=2 Tax=Marivita geojedonensis TaxID=1123756 RepID=A0A1X4NK15_9RHOB|nr:helix-turn-helix domain-containing protein [Marivita geojedonensis]OSQ50564.1 HxlR family transcriptional regulator [Marivita geojedonensis]PRY79854.1 HxlR family transcriptional regulator [Marivita geojedonensis]
MLEANYPKFCPVAMAASLLEPRWTMLLLCEMWSGSTRFNEIQRGVPGMSPGLLSKRLKEMEANGLVARQADSQGRAEYLTTALADELEPLIRGLGEWAHRNIDCEVSLQNLDARLLMWKIRGKIDRLQLPKPKCVIQFVLNDAPNETANYWLVAKPGEETDLCYTDPKFDVDLFVVCELRALTSAWMGHTTFEKEIDAGRITLTGHDLMERTLTKWLMRSSFAEVSKGADEERHRAAV